MCGIAGVINLDGAPADGSALEAMGIALAHRGPDDSGVTLFGTAGLVHRRLSIIDLSPAGHGPMANEDQTVWITFNGEVYNYRELMPELISHGHRFRSVCDTEVVLHAYEEYGERCVERFNGMFALAIFDSRKRRLFCARDRSGVKPFYYASSAQCFAFASEPKALLVLPWVRRDPDDGVIYDYLCHGVVDHTDHTFFSGIRSLPAAHTATVDVSGMTATRYWSLPTPDPETLARPASAAQLAAWADQFLALMQDSVALRLRSDVAVGSCLSGGLDSSLLVSEVNRLLFPQAGPELAEQWHRRGEKQKTFSACFDDPAIDERRFIEAVTAQTGASAHYTYPRGEDFSDVLRSVVYQQDEPFLSTGIVAQWYVMQLARSQGVKVLLDGQGADEVLCGYSGYYGPYFADLLRAGRLADLTREVSLYNRYHRARWGSGERQLAMTMASRHAWMRPRIRSRFDPSRGRPPWLGRELAHRYAAGTPGSYPAGFEQGVPGYLPAVAARLFMATSLPALLRYEDRNSMAFSVEARVPYLDYRLVEYAFKAPNAMRFGDGLNKRVLRKAARGLIPETVRHRRDKLGYTTPEAQWLRGPAADLVRGILSAPAVTRHGYLQADVVRDGLDSFFAGGSVPAALVWRWVNLELWLRVFVDEPSPAARTNVPATATAASIEIARA